MKTFIILVLLLTLYSCTTYQVEKPSNVVDTVTTKYGVFYLDSAGVILDQK